MRRLTLSVVVSGFAIGLIGTVYAQQDGTEIGVLHLQGNVYMLVGAGGNIAVQIGPEGVVVVDTGTEPMGESVRQAIHELTDRPVRLIINTHVHPDHTGGNEILARGGQPLFSSGVGGVDEATATIVAQENVLLSGATDAETPLPDAAWPTDTYIGPLKEFFLNGEGILIIYVPGAHTDGDSLVYFRRSDVLVTGDLFVTTNYPVIDRDRGGTYAGFIEGLNRILDITLPEEKQEGGTYVIPGHGRAGDEADVHEYRDMATIIRDRVRDMVDRGMTLDEIKTADVSIDYDGRYRDTELWTQEMFIEAVYESVMEERE